MVHVLPLPIPDVSPGVTLYPNVCRWIRHSQSTVTVNYHSEYSDPPPTPLIPVIVVIILHVMY